MYIIFQKEAGVAIAKAKMARREEQGIATEDAIYVDNDNLLDFREVDDSLIPADFTGHKYLYNPMGVAESVFAPNPNYVEYLPPEEEIARLKAEIAQLKSRTEAVEDAALQLILSQPSS